MIELTNQDSIKVKMQIMPSGKAPIKYGNNVFRFEDYTLSVILPKRGWELITKTKNFQYLQIPDNLKEPFIIEINIPKKEFVLELAKEFYKNEESVLDQIGEWPLSYQHKVSKDLIEYFYDIEKKETIENKIVNSPRSFLFIGGSIWSSEVSIVDGEMEYHENIENIIEGDSNIEKINEVSSFVEGKKYWINISRYERDDSARKRCLDHYGSSCQICGFNFEKVYGSFGKDIIHVHHKKPLADIGKEYIVDPIKDLIPVCANCHTIIHSKEEAFSIIEVIQMIKRK